MKTSIVVVAVAGLSMCSLAFAGDMSSAEKMKKIDTNGDGRISAAEHDAGSKMMFQKMDSNQDGFVTAAEMDAAHGMMKQGDRMDGDKMRDDKMMDDKMMDDDDMKPAPATRP